MLMTGAHQLQRTVQKRAREELPTPKVRGGNREPQAATARERLRGAVSCPRSGAAVKTSHPRLRLGQWPRGATHLQGAAAVLVQEGQEDLLYVQGQGGNLVQGKEQRLRFAGAAMKRYLTSKVREIQVRRWVFRRASEGRHTNHNHRKLVNLITQPCLTQ